MILTIAAVLATVQLTVSPDDRERIDRVLAQTPLIDGHNDLPWQVREHAGFSVEDLQSDDRFMTDMERLRAGRVGAQLWSVYISAETTGPEAIKQTIEQLDVMHRLVEAYPDTLELARTADEIVRIHASGKVASMAGVEGGHQIGGSLAALRSYYELGARYMTLTHGNTTGWADSATDAPRHGGLSEFGVKVVKEMNRLGMLVDLSHVTEETMNDALDASAAPVIFSHSSARAIGSHPRNVPDAVLERLPENGGVVMVTFVPPFLSDVSRNYFASRDAEDARLASLYTGNPDGLEAAKEAWREANPAPDTTVSDVADHIEHVARVAGHDHVGIGGDLDGITSAPLGLGSVDGYPLLFAELIHRGWSDENLAKLAGGNFLRALRKAEAVSASMADTDPIIEPAPEAD